MGYVERVLNELIAKNPGEKEFHQAATEILTSIAPFSKDIRNMKKPRF